jgi:hypothetical protein
MCEEQWDDGRANRLLDGALAVLEAAGDWQTPSDADHGDPRQHAQIRRAVLQRGRAPEDLAPRRSDEPQERDRESQRPARRSPRALTGYVSERFRCPDKPLFRDFCYKHMFKSVGGGLWRSRRGTPMGGRGYTTPVPRVPFSFSEVSGREELLHRPSC